MLRARGTGPHAMSKERRQHPRLSMAVEVDFASEHNFYTGQTRDLSVGGLFVETDVALPIGTRVKIDLKFSQKRIEAEAEVVWALVGASEAVEGLGVRFVDLPAAALKSIEAFMAVREPMDFRMIDDDT